MIKNIRRFAGLALLCLGAGCVSVAPGSDPLVVRAEQATQIALDSFTLFAKLESAHREQVKIVAPHVHAAAEKLREVMPGWLESARKLTKSYQASKSQPDREALVEAISILEDITLEITYNITKMQELK